jgi:hypothetical protein
MTSMDVEKLLEALEEIVSSSGTWSEKKKDILLQSTAKDRTNLIEVCSWFEDLTDDPDDDKPDPEDEEEV